MILELGDIAGHADDRDGPASRRTAKNRVAAAEPAPAAILVPHPVVELQDVIVGGNIQTGKVLLEPRQIGRMHQRRQQPRSHRPKFLFRVADVVSDRLIGIYVYSLFDIKHINKAWRDRQCLLEQLAVQLFVWRPSEILRLSAMVMPPGGRTTSLPTTADRAGLRNIAFDNRATTRQLQ